jgi:hypothetical protein
MVNSLSHEYQIENLIIDKRKTVKKAWVFLTRSEYVCYQKKPRHCSQALHILLDKLIHRLTMLYCFQKLTSEKFYSRAVYYGWVGGGGEVEEIEKKYSPILKLIASPKKLSLRRPWIIGWILMWFIVWNHKF